MKNFDKTLTLFSKIKKVYNNKDEMVPEISRFIIEKKWSEDQIIEYYQKNSKNINDFKKWRIDTHRIALYQLIIGNKYCHPLRWFPKRHKDTLYKVNQKCNINKCDTELYQELTIDHIELWSKDRKTTIANAQLLCKEHNSSKGNKNAAEWLKTSGF